MRGNGCVNGSPVHRWARSGAQCVPTARPRRFGGVGPMSAICWKPGAARGRNQAEASGRQFGYDYAQMRLFKTETFRRSHPSRDSRSSVNRRAFVKKRSPGLKAPCRFSTTRC